MLLRMKAELVYFALSVAAGLLAALLGAGVKWLHQSRRLAIWLGFLDLAYWFLLGFALFLLCFFQNSGVFRGYAAAGTALGYAIVWAVAALWRKDGGWRRVPKRKVKKKKKEEP